MLDARSARFRHQVASEKAEIGLAVNLAQRTHKARGMQVATGFAYYNVILHRSK